MLSGVKMHGAPILLVLICLQAAPKKPPCWGSIAGTWSLRVIFVNEQAKTLAMDHDGPKSSGRRHMVLSEVVHTGV